MDFELTREQQAVRELARDFGLRQVAPVIQRFDEAQEFPHAIMAELFAKVEALQKGLSDRNNAFDRKTARELYLFLIQPVGNSIRGERLVIIPHDALHALPFQLLENPSEGSSLGERYQLSYAPSATIQMGLRKTAVSGSKTLLAAADPEISEGENEVESIAKLYSPRSKVMLDSLIKESDVKASVSDYDVVHR